MSCERVREDLTALADGALPAAAAAALRAHLDACDGCAREARELAAATALSREFLAAELPVLRPGFDTRMRALLEGESRSGPGRHLWRPLLAGALAAAVAVLVLASSTGGPSSVLVPLGIQAPPPELAEKPALFRDYEILEHLDELEHFETVIQVPLEPAGDGGRKGAG